MSTTQPSGSETWWEAYNYALRDAAATATGKRIAVLALDHERWAASYERAEELLRAEFAPEAAQANGPDLDHLCLLRSMGMADEGSRE